MRGASMSGGDMADEWFMRNPSTGSGRAHAKGAGRKQDRSLEIRKRVKSLFSKMCVLHLYEKMPPNVRESICRGWCHDPVLEFDPSFPSAEAFGGAYAAIRQTAIEGFERAKVKYETFELSLKDFWAIASPMALYLRRMTDRMASPLYTGPQMSAAVRTFLRVVTPLVEEVVRQDAQNAMQLALHDTLVAPLVSRSRTDSRLLHAKVTSTMTERGSQMVVTLHSEEPPMKYVRLEGRKSGGSRPMYRVGTSNTWNGIEWASWTRESLKGHWQDQVGIGEGEAWPVYVQSHALKQMRERLNAYAYAEWAEHWMYQSLMTPKIVSRLSADELLVAFEVQGDRLGYLVVTAKDGLVAVRTFLFLTMSNTPEGRMLEKRLKLTRDELTYLRMHELSRFTQTDLKDDPKLSALLRECGCGHLLELAEDEYMLHPGATQPKAFATELKQYVGMAA